MGKLQQKLKECNCIAIDTNLFIYLVEKNPNYAEAAKYVFERVERGLLHAVTSSLVIEELLVKPFEVGDFILAKRYKTLISAFPNLTLREIDHAVLEKSAEIRAKYKIRTPDAIFIATALLEKADIFITNDARLKSIKDIEVVILNEVV